jgi:hypothetical protein
MVAAGTTSECHALSFLRLGDGLTEVAARFHALVQDTNDLHKAGLDRAVVDDMDGQPDGAATGILTNMSQVEAADAGKESIPIRRDRTFWIGRDPPHGGDQ